MRQKLIKKKTVKSINELGDMLQEAAKKKLSKDATSHPLHSILFDATVGKDKWATGLKEHSRTLIDTLLNDDIEGFEEYIESHLVEFAQSKDAMSRVSESGLMKIDHKAFLQEFLQLAVLIEHSTIPAYLTSLYSIKDGTNAMASGIIRSVVVEEMLHMIIVCNVMNALDITPSVNKPQNYPVYPIKLPLNVDFYVGLEKFSTNSLATFISIESPSSPKVETPNFDEKVEDPTTFSADSAEEGFDLWDTDNLNEFLANNVETIGEFYDVLFFFIVVFQVMEYYKATGKLPTKFEEINTGGLFTGDPARQIGSEQYYGSGGKLHKVDSLLGVMEVFKEIKGQGEGADDNIFDVDSGQFEEGAELAHYFRFKEIFHEHFYIGGDYEPFADKDGMMPITTPPVGRELKVDWNEVYPVKTNIKLSDMSSNPELYAQAKAFNNTYKSLLDAIQEAVEGNPDELEKSVIHMYALKEQATELMKQPLNGQENAGPTFEYPSN